jgi:hypothetical protein
MSRTHSKLCTANASFVARNALTRRDGLKGDPLENDSVVSKETLLVHRKQATDFRKK